MAAEIFLLSKSKTIWRLDVFPFIILYLFASYAYWDLIEEEVFGKLLLVAVVLIHALFYILGHWSSRFRAYIEFSHLKGTAQEVVSASSHVKVFLTKKDRGSVCEICELQENVETDVIFFHFHKKKYIYDREKSIFIRLKPTLERTLKEFTSQNPKQAKLFDENVLEIPLRSFQQLLKDQVMEPFSFFQFFSVSLWLLDENRFYALLTLFMLFMSSCTVVIQRIRTMLMLRGMKLQPQYIHVYRGDKWTKISSEDLLPGDICQILPANSLKPVENQNDKKEAEIIREAIPFAHILPPRLLQAGNTNNANSYKSLPCDFLLLWGSCVANESILTGESVPQIKDPVEKIPPETVLNLRNQNKASLLFCGTEIIQTFASESAPLPDFIKIKPPVSTGSIACVVRTGFETSKGKLIRTVLFNNENMSVKQTDAFLLIFVLLIFSIISSVYVLKHGLEDTSRDRSKLFIRCILIVTTVVPPELPMILTLAVNNSLLYLQRKKIFCTEPFRIPLAGKVSVCAFDKTGTLTSDSLLFKGIAENCLDYKTLKHFDSVTDETAYVLAGCHSVVSSEKKLLGDPIELMFFEEGKSWSYDANDKIARSRRGGEKTIRIKVIFAFKSSLKRMATIVNCQTQGSKQEFRALCKGAPEVIQTLLKNVPEGYHEAYQYYTRLGYRVLALAYKPLNISDDLNNWERDRIESDLIFSGFLICESPLKKNTAAQVSQLQEAAYNVIMITGDNMLTAISVARQLKLGNIGATNFLQVKVDKIGDNSDLKTTVTWIDELEKEVAKGENFDLLSKKNVLCIGGPELEKLSNKFSTHVVKDLVKNITVFARTSPNQKEYIVNAFKAVSGGASVLMCGDGTNDVGGLKKADVGIALVGLREDLEELELQHQKEKAAARNAPKNDPMGELFNDSNNFKFGDASIAAPFTSKHFASIRCVNIVLTQGVCTLVTTFQTYKILSLSSLIAAYSLTSLHMQALKFSELQSTIIGISAAANYYFFSNCQPLKKLHATRPSTRLFEPYFVISVAGQTVLHLYAMDWVVQHIGVKYSSEEELKIKHDEEFIPTFLNTVVFLFSLLSQTCVFLFNYGGEPFMESLTTNKKFFKFLIAPAALSVFLALDLSDDFSYAFELKFAGVKEEAKYELFMVFVIVLVVNYVWERLLKFIKYRKVYDWI